MFSLIKFIDKARLLRIELPAILISIVLAEQFYKFGSFTLELICFMLSWIGIGYVFNRFTKQHD